MEYYSRECELSRTTKLGHGYATLPQDRRRYLAGRFLSKKNAFADERVSKTQQKGKKKTWEKWDNKTPQSPFSIPKLWVNGWDQRARNRNL